MDSSFDWKSYELALEISREIGDRSSEAALLSNLGIACSSSYFFDHGSEMRAIEYYEQALT